MNLQLNCEIKTKDLQQYIYIFEIHLKESLWVIRRRYCDFVQLDKQLKKEVRRRRLPDLPFQKEPIGINFEQILTFLEIYLNEIK